MLYKNTLIKIKKSFGRYLSLFVMVMVGVGFFAGISESAPDMSAVADQYYKDHNLLDFKVASSMGLTEDDVTALKKLKNVSEVVPSYSLNVLAKDKTIRVHALEDKVNTLKLVEGRMPEAEDECIADSKSYKPGDKIKITDDVSDELKTDEYTVVGTAESVLYLADDYGSTTNGDGKLSAFIFINKNNFIIDAYTEIYLIAADSKDTAAYSVAYDTAAAKLKDELIQLKTDRETARYQEIYDKADKEISKNQTKLNEEKAKGEKKLSDAKDKLNTNAKKLKDGKAELTENEEKLQKNTDKQNKEFDTAKAQIKDGWDKINTALTQNGIKRAELDSKTSELKAALDGMKAQVLQLPKDSTEYMQLSETIKQYTASYQGLIKLKASIDTLTTNEAKLNQGIDTFHSEIQKAKQKIEKGKKDIVKNEKKLKDGYDKYNKNLEKFNKEISDGQKKIDDARKDLSEIEKPQWYILDRDASVGYSDLKSDINVVTSVAAVFPFFFILLGMLMTSNSMTRLIAEERGELGTLTSLGYKDHSIVATYLFYILSATVLGTGAGFYLGCRVIPPLIYSTFQYILPSIIIQYNLVTFALILGVTAVLMIGLTVFTCRKELKQKPAVLMRPVPLPSGQTILLERIRPLWNHLSFTWKVTIRNMFRYKKRAFMTIVGVAGCTSLLLVGFGLRDSMRGIAQKQYGDILRYSDMIILKDETKTIDDEFKNTLTKENIKEPLLLRQSAFKCSGRNKSLDTYLIVPENKEVFYNYFNLKSDSGGATLSLEDNGVIVTEKLAEILNAGKGDTITVKDTDNNEYSLTVSSVARNYTANYIYMSKELSRKIFDKTTAYNAIVSNHGTTDENALAKRLIDSGYVMNVIFTSDVLKKALDSNDSLNSIIILIVVVASLLAIIVLYNLTSINISERTREIATLKVLGFTDKEANGYIYREALILTLISIGMGLILGIVLHRFVLGVLEGDEMVLSKKIEVLSFLLACGLTMAFSVIMQFVTYIKLKTIDMIESLKSVE
jgi:putative ABC transport system permease protein